LNVDDELGSSTLKQLLDDNLCFWTPKTRTWILGFLMAGVIKRRKVKRP